MYDSPYISESQIAWMSAPEAQKEGRVLCYTGYAACTRSYAHHTAGQLIVIYPDDIQPDSTPLSLTELILERVAAAETSMW